MMNLRRVFLIFLFLFIPFHASALKSGERIKEFSLRDYNGNLHHLKDYCGETEKGKRVLVIDFFASWCEACKKAFRILTSLYEKYEKRGMRVLIISFQQKERQIREFLKGNTPSFPVLMDKYGDVARQFGVYGLPRTFIIRGNCTLKRELIGELPNLEEVLEKEIKEELE